ncbi:hypothetical protein [Streptosporangium sp. NPDC000509]|uniref:hypothetical protein n=1 Tax=Streptosporangium sp. NPDC000509 TaxID=3366186 RepID=UPI003688A2F7
MLDLIAGSLDYIDERSRRLWPGQVGHRHGREDHLAFLRARELPRERKAPSEGAPAWRPLPRNARTWHFFAGV